MKKFKLKVGIDVDDVLFSCNQYAIDQANANLKFEPPLSIQELVTWGRSGKRSDVIFHYYKEPWFFETQPVLAGAHEFIRKLSLVAEVFFITAISPEFMGIRAKRLIKEFPWVPAENIIMGSCKSMINVDVLLDDGAHNTMASNSAYPVLMRMPWNQHMTGCLSVNNYQEFLTLIDTIIESYTGYRKNAGNQIIALVGPSASGKTELMKRMIADGLAVRIPSYTTRSPRVGETDKDYRFLSKETFLQMEKEGRFFETTRYAGECYGSCKENIKQALSIHSHVVMALDICGAIALKHAFPENTKLVFLSRPKEHLLQAILERNCSNEEKVTRMMSLPDENKNEELCDETIHNDGEAKDMLTQMKQILL